MDFPFSSSFNLYWTLPNPTQFKTRASPLKILSRLITFLCLKYKNFENGFSLAWISCSSFTIDSFYTNTMMYICHPHIYTRTQTCKLFLVVDSRQPTAVSICATHTHAILWIVYDEGVLHIRSSSTFRRFVYASKSKRSLKIGRTMCFSVPV